MAGSYAGARPSYAGSYAGGAGSYAQSEGSSPRASSVVSGMTGFESHDAFGEAARRVSENVLTNGSQELCMCIVLGARVLCRLPASRRWASAPTTQLQQPAEA